MNVAVRRPMSFDEFLASEEHQELRFEFDASSRSLLSMARPRIRRSGVTSCSR